MRRSTSKRTARSNCCFRIADRVLVYFRWVSDPKPQIIQSSWGKSLPTTWPEEFITLCFHELTTGRHRTKEQKSKPAAANLNNLLLIWCHKLTSRYSINDERWWVSMANPITALKKDNHIRQKADTENIEKINKISPKRTRESGISEINFRSWPLTNIYPTESRKSMNLISSASGPLVLFIEL